MDKKFQRIFLIITLVFGSLLLVSIRDVFAAPPVVTGVEDGKYYNAPVTITFDEDGGVTATLNGIAILSEDVVSEDGTYILIATDGVETTTINFWIDTIKPVVTGVTNGAYYNDPPKTPVISETSPYNATLNGLTYTSGNPITDDGVYELIVTDSANNVTTVNFTIDTIPPEVTGVEDGEYYNTDRTITFNEGSATLNTVLFTSGTTVINEGTYTLVVTDLAGNITTINFVIDKTPPEVTGVEDGEYYNTDRTITFNEGSATLNTVLFTSGTTVINEGTYTLVVTDLAGNITTINFVIDKTPPEVTGVEDGEYYNTDRTITFNEGSATLNTVLFTSGTTVINEGTYTLVVTDLAGNITTINFVIDKTPPEVTGVEDGEYYNTDRTITFNEGSATLNTVLFTSGTTVINEGTYTLVVTDLATNVTTITFTIDNSAPVVNGVEDGKYYNTDRTITFNEGSATLNTVLFTSGTTVINEGTYTLVVTDLAGNITTINFVIDKTPPEVTGVEDGEYYNTDRTITFNEGSATLNTVLFTSGTTVINEGTYTLVVTDLAGNITTINFVIDKTPPEVTGVEDGEYYNTDRTITFNEGSATLNTVLFTSGTTVINEGTYTLVVTDLAGNITTITFVIDKTPPEVTGVEDGEYYNTDRTITFNEGSATLNTVLFTSGTTVTNEGTYTLVVADLAGNITAITFVIDKIPPVITIATYTLTPTNQDITVFATTNEGSLNAPSHTFTQNGSFVFIATDLAGNITQTTVTITNIDKDPPIITGVVDGVHYNTNRSPTFNEGAATLNGSGYISGTLISQENNYTLIVSDPAGNITTVSFTIDKTPPVVIGVSDGIYYNTNRLITFNEGSATLNDNLFTSGQTVTVEGSYTLIVTDLAGNITTVSFVLDKTLPIITIEPYNLDPTNVDIIVYASTNEGSLNATSHTFTENGSFTFIATDLAGNVSERIITITNIDKNAPAVIGVSNNAFYNIDRTITFDKGTATLNGLTFVSGTIVSNEGSYILIVTDDAGNSTTVNFVIDKTAPIVSGVANNTYYNTNRTITFNEGSATLNGIAFSAGSIVSNEGTYQLIVTDLALNVTTVNFVIDKTVPVVSGVANNTYYNTNRTITFNEGSATLNATAFTSGTIVSTENTYVLVVTDLAGNKTTVNFVIDKTVPVVSGVANNVYYNTNRTITFNEGSATLNGIAFTSGTIVSTENTYVLVVTDLAGNKTTVNFVLDKTPPVITIAPYESVLAVSSVTVNASVNEGSLNATSRLFTANGSYKFIATDLAGNISERTIIISNIGYTINYSLVGTGGDLIAMVNSIMVNSGNLVIEGRSIMFTATPATRYRVYAWRLDGNVVGDRSNTYLLNMLNRGMNVTVEFVLEGDLNSNGSVTSTDLIILRRYLAGIDSLNDKGLASADINNDGKLTSTDLIILRRRLAGLE
jgi:hypothetical protein